MIVLIINGPNLNLLGVREEKHYGSISLSQINKELSLCAKKMRIELLYFQSNHEGKIIDCIQKERKRISGILINAGALTHYGYSLRDALSDTQLPVVEVHLSNIFAREPFRRTDIISDIVIGGVFGFKKNSYCLGLIALVDFIKIHQKK